jgi:hypothetical protein
MDLHIVKSGEFFLLRSKLSKHPNLSVLAKKKVDTEIIEEDTKEVAKKRQCLQAYKKWI